VTILGQREYLVHQQLTLVNEGSGQPQKQNLWVAMIRDFPPYQQVQSMEVSPKDYKIVVDEYGNHYAEFDFSGQPAGTTQTVKINYQVAVNELAYDLSVCQGALPDEFNQPELHIESANPQIVALAGKLSQAKGTVCQRVRAFYDYIGNTLVYTYNGANWGAQAALGPMGADCTEYSDCWWRLAGRKAFRRAISKDCCIWTRERMPSLQPSMRGRTCTCPLLAGLHWIPPWDGHSSTATFILPTIRRITLLSHWGRTRLCYEEVTTGRISTGRATVPQ
jgi:hypothetical protein